MSVGQIDMRLANHLLRHPLGVWDFYLIVPADLQPLLGRRVIKKSLGTRDPVVARAWAYALGAQYAHRRLPADGKHLSVDQAFMLRQRHGAAVDRYDVGVCPRMTTPVPSGVHN